LCEPISKDIKDGHFEGRDLLLFRTQADPRGGKKVIRVGGPPHQKKRR